MTVGLVYIFAFIFGSGPGKQHNITENSGFTKELANYLIEVNSGHNSIIRFKSGFRTSKERQGNEEEGHKLLT